ncbi:ABC transporter permease [Paenibacillus sp. LS1]|uniref:ABC transporter permease n=1 Tax=Paenibacillus sp. LS1 TaxID=2992120 RepID=UPI002231DB79|nr:ABC transporter permease [Paenibacillus sp. LS1]MCW3793938.1 ABC transporter permease [Paenibacillus sp. LS1]
MNNASSALKVAAGIFLTIALITIVVLLFVSAQEATKTAQNNFSEIQTELSQASYAVYDGTTISGSQVLNATRKYASREQFGIQIKTGKNTAGTWYNKVVNVTDPVGSTTYGSISGSASGVVANTAADSHNEYVNPSGTFKSSLVYDKSGVVRGLVFVQQ